MESGLSSLIETVKWRQFPAIRDTVHEARALARRRSSGQRMLPSFLIIGGQRCGTTSLYRYLCEHPDVVEPIGKELHYFSYKYTKSTPWYQSHFPRMGPSSQQTFEATPYYLFHPAAPGRVHSLLPAARLVVLLRNPVDRAFSHYQHNVGGGVEPLPFEAALDAEEMRIGTDAQRLMVDPSYAGLAYRRYSYFARGCYADQLESWLGYFPRSQMLIVASEDFYGDTDAVFGEVLEFLGLTPLRLDSYPRYTRRGPWHGPPMSDGVRRQLAGRFAKPNKRLEELLGRDFGWDE